MSVTVTMTVTIETPVRHVPTVPYAVTLRVQVNDTYLTIIPVFEKVTVTHIIFKSLHF